MFGGLGRGIDIRLVSNRFFVVGFFVSLAGFVGLAAASDQLGYGEAVTSAISVAIAWMIGRELDPDHVHVATFAMLLAGTADHKNLATRYGSLPGDPGEIGLASCQKSSIASTKLFRAERVMKNPAVVLHDLERSDDRNGVGLIEWIRPSVVSLIADSDLMPKFVPAGADGSGRDRLRRVGRCRSLNAGVGGCRRRRATKILAVESVRS